MNVFIENGVNETATDNALWIWSALESQIPESPVDVGNHSPKASMVCTADHSSQQSPLSCEGSVCDRSSDYEDFWRPLSSRTSPGWHDMINTLWQQTFLHCFNSSK